MIKIPTQEEMLREYDLRISKEFSDTEYSFVQWLYIVRQYQYGKYKLINQLKFIERQNELLSKINEN